MPDPTFKGREVVGCYEPDPTNSNKMKAITEYLSPEAVKCKELNKRCAALSLSGRQSCVDAVIPQIWPRLGIAQSNFVEVNKCPIEYPFGTVKDFTCPAPTNNAYSDANQKWKKTLGYTIEGNATGFQDGSSE